jgi:hypothetical protein
MDSARDSSARVRLELESRLESVVELVDLCDYLTAGRTNEQGRDLVDAATSLLDATLRHRE